MKAYRPYLFLVAILALVLSACGPAGLTPGGTAAEPRAMQDKEAMAPETDKAMDADEMMGESMKDSTMDDKGMQDADMEAEEKAMADEMMDETGMDDAGKADGMSKKAMDGEQADEDKMDDEEMGGQEQGMGEEMADEEAMVDEMDMEASQTFRVRIENISADSGFATPLAPGVWVLHPEGTPLFQPGAPDPGLGLEALAEDGDPAPLAAALADRGLTVGIFDTPVGASGPGPLFPGEAYEFEVTGTKAVRYLSFASMVVQSNDLFIAPGPSGIDLFGASHPAAGMEQEAQALTLEIHLWDAGTEVNEVPGSGPNQAPRQPAPNTGPQDPDPTVRPADPGLGYPPASMLVRVTVTPVR